MGAADDPRRAWIDGERASGIRGMAEGYEPHGCLAGSSSSPWGGPSGLAGGAHSGHAFGGELRRVGLAQVLVHNPRAALLDEPTAGLDPAQRMQFREILTRLAERTALLVSTHQTDDLAAVFDKVAVLVAGRILFTGCVTEFLELGAESGVARGETAYMALLRRHSR